MGISSFSDVRIHPDGKYDGKQFEPLSYDGRVVDRGKERDDQFSSGYYARRYVPHTLYLQSHTHG